MFVPFAWLSAAVLVAGTSPAAVSPPALSSQAGAPSVVADSGSDPIPLTDEMLTNYIALKKDLAPFWKAHDELHKTAAAHSHTATLTVDGAPLKIGAFDYPTLVTQDTALAGIFTRHHFAPKQFEPTQVSTFKAVAEIVAAEAGAAAAPSDTTTMAGKNVALVKAHRKDLQAVGVDLKVSRGGGGMGGMGGNDDLNP